MPRRRDRTPREVPAAALLRGLRATVLVLLVATGPSVLGAAPASAHARFTGSDPAEGAELAALPDAVVMSYSEEIAPQFVETAVITPDGATVPTEATAVGADVTVDIAAADLPEVTQGGTWQVVARVVSVDGHPVEHTTTFVVPAPAGAADPTDAPAEDDAAAAAGAAAGDPSDEPAAGPGTSPAADPTSPAADPTSAVTDALPRWVVVGGAAALVLAAAAALLVQLRRRPPTG